MIRLACLMVIFSGLLFSVPALSADDSDTEKYATCGGYYKLLSLPYMTPFVDDISSGQADRAFYVMTITAFPDAANPMKTRGEIGPVVAKFSTMQDEVPKPVTREGVAAFREKYDAQCRALLEQLIKQGKWEQ